MDKANEGHAIVGVLLLRFANKLPRNQLIIIAACKHKNPGAEEDNKDLWDNDEMRLEEEMWLHQR